MRTTNGGRAAVGMDLCVHSTTLDERRGILAREELLRKWRKSLPRKRKPAHEKPGPVTIIQLSR